MNEMPSEKPLNIFPSGLLINALAYSSSVGMISSFPTGQAKQVEIEYVNQAFIDFANSEESEIIGKNPFVIFKTSADSQQLDVFYQALLLGKSIRPEIYLELPSGDSIWIRFIVTSYHENGRSYQLWIQQELSKKKKEELSFEKQKEHLSRLFEDSEEIVFCIDAYGQCIYANGAFYRHTGKDSGYWTENQILSNLHSAEDEDPENAFRGAIQGVQQTLLASLKGRNSHALWFSFTLTPLLAHGKVSAVYFVGREATMLQLKQRYELQITNLIALFQGENDLKSILRKVITTLSLKFGWECAEVWLPDYIHRRMKLFSWNYPEGEAFKELLDVTRSGEISDEIEHALKTKKGQSLPHKATHLYIDENFPRKEYAQKAGMAVGFSMPVIFGDNTVALFSFLASQKSPEFSEDLIFVVRELSQRLGVYIEKQRISYESEQMFELVPDFLCVLEANGRIYKANRQILETVGLSQTEIRSLSFVDLIDEDYQELTLAKLREVKSGQTVTFENILKGKNVSSLLEWSFTYNPDEQIIYAAAKDITLRIKYDEEQRKGNERFQLFSEAINDAIYEWDVMNDNIVWGNGFHRLFGHQDIQSYNNMKGWSSFIHEMDKARVEGNLSIASLKKERLWIEEYRFRCIDGSYKSILDRGVFIYNSKGECERMVGVMQDITPLKESEETLIKLNDALQQRAKQLQGFNKELEQFAYIVSHDLQEPLRMISSFMQLLQNSDDVEKNEKSEQYISFAIDGALRMKRLIRDLLTYSRVGTTEEDFQDVDVNAILDDTIMVYQEIIKSKSAEIKIANCPNIRAIHSLVGQLFDNLISNALKYNRSNKPIIEIGFSETDSHHVFFVKDNGIGIDPKHFDMIYLPFKRLHNKNEYSGTGIGLAVCKKIVEKHEGKMWVESIPGEGSKFSFSIIKELSND